MAKKRVAEKFDMQVKACPKPPPKNLGTIVKDVILMRDLRRSAFLYFWLLINIFVAKELIIKPLLIAQSIAPLVTHIADQNVKITCPLDGSFRFKPNATYINFTLAGNPRGYKIRALAAFTFLCSSEGSKGFCRINITVLLNGKEFFRLVRDEEIVASGGSQGTIEIPINRGGAWTNLIMKNNTLILLVTVAPILHNYGRGFADIRIGPVSLIVESLDTDADEVPDPVDNLEGNNQIIFLTSLILPLMLAIANEKLRPKL
ncbi:MAG: hypothetical protein N3E47_03275 [Candidatus Bathyarchaeota archaeon]|nr:hypothetical protein [Candidatus Bathyarchaeota archaeon]